MRAFLSVTLVLPWGETKSNSFLGSSLQKNQTQISSLERFSDFIIPIVCKNIEKVFRNFLWKGVEAIEGSHSGRTMLKTPRSLEGWEWKISVLNMALFSKWLWRFEKQNCALWRTAVKSKYGP